jgi:predicted DNA-binding transcriptional regulator AlpA
MTKTKTKKPAKAPRPSRFLIDRRAAELVDKLKSSGRPDDILTTPALAELTAMSAQFYELGRMKSRAYGPAYCKIGNMIGYRRDEVIKWLEERAALYAERRPARPVHYVTVLR